MIGARLTELKINDILPFLGTKGAQLPPDEMEKIGRCRELVTSAAEPKLVYKRLPVCDGKIDGICLEGKDIREHLEGAVEVVIFAATIGLKVDQLIAREQVTDLSMAVIADSIASCAVENVCDNFEEDLRAQVESEGYFITERYSPGYGDLPLKTQKDIERFLNCQRRIGVMVSDNYLMTPIKSVTAIIGITKKKKPCRIHVCDTCASKETCILRLARMLNRQEEGLDKE